MEERREDGVPPPLSLADSCQESLVRPEFCAWLRQGGLGIRIKGSAGEHCSASDPPVLKPSLFALPSQHQMLAKVPSFQNTNLPTAMKWRTQKKIPLPFFFQFCVLMNLFNRGPIFLFMF